MKPVIGILGVSQKGNNLDVLGKDYSASVIAAGGLPVVLPLMENTEDCEMILSQIDGLLIPGGIDINPLMYRENPAFELGETDYAFDIWQAKMLRLAMEKRMPVLGICRGLQIINVVLGGTLWQDLSLRDTKTFLHAQKENSRSGCSHAVTVMRDTKLSAILSEKLLVNSFHHQAVHELGRGLRISAVSDDGIVEAVEMDDYPYLLAIQWHPENFIHCSDHPMLEIFTSFVKSSQKNIHNKKLL